MKTFLILLSLTPTFVLAEPAITQKGNTITIKNKNLTRTITTEDTIATTSIQNHLDGKTLTSANAQAFTIQLENGTNLTPADFIITGTQNNSTSASSNSKSSATTSLTLNLTSKTKPTLQATLTYSIGAENPFTRKSLTITPSDDLKITKIDLESLTLPQAYQPYTIRQITAKGARQWRPGLGQPLYTKETGTFWGIEHPASINTVKDGKLTCSYLVGKTIKAGQTLTTHNAVLGVADSPEFTREAFFSYIDQTRVRPLRLQTQYNSWFNQGQGVNAKRFIASIQKINNELSTTRGVPPLSAYVIDDGWQNISDWSKTVWNVNKKFHPTFKNSRAAAKAANSSLGLWLSPGAIFGGQRAIPSMRKAGFRFLDPWMSIAHPLYMDKLTTRFQQLTKTGITYFKLDGIFGHLNIRNFDVPGFKGSEKELNNPKYDLAKIQYLTDGSDRLINAFKKMHGINPEVYIVISNGAWLSPWWLHHIDAVWMINAGDAAGGSDRTAELVYRDTVYHQLATTENTQFPLHSIFNHEPKKRTSKETKDTFRKYLYMNMSRGTGFIELYIKPDVLKPYDWDVLAEGLLWAHRVFPTFKNAKMHGGNPAEKEIYGYTAWLPESGYISLHNPSHEPQEYTLTLDRNLGLTKSSDKTTYHLTSPLADSLTGLNPTYARGDQITITLKPKEIRILNFNTEKPDWTKLTDLQTRTKDDYTPPKPIDLTGHPIIGTWEYGPHTRQFKPNGTCILKTNSKVQWTKPFIATSKTTAIVEGKYTHKIQKDGTLQIENKYTAKKQ